MNIIQTKGYVIDNRGYIMKNINNPKAYVLVGLPGMGKTTWCEARKMQFKRISSDQFIDLWADDDGLTYDQAFSKYSKFAELSFFNILKDCTDNQLSIMIDRTNLTVKSRARYFPYLKNYDVYAIVCLANEEVWRQRLANPDRKGKNIPQHVLDDMGYRFEYPTKEEGFLDVLSYHSDLEFSG